LIRLSARWTVLLNYLIKSNRAWWREVSMSQPASSLFPSPASTLFWKGDFTRLDKGKGGRSTSQLFLLASVGWTLSLLRRLWIKPHRSAFFARGLGDFAKIKIVKNRNRQNNRKPGAKSEAKEMTFEGPERAWIRQKHFFLYCHYNFRHIVSYLPICLCAPLSCFAQPSGMFHPSCVLFNRRWTRMFTNPWTKTRAKSALNNLTQQGARTSEHRTSCQRLFLQFDTPAKKMIGSLSWGFQRLLILTTVATSPPGGVPIWFFLLL